MVELLRPLVINTQAKAAIRLPKIENWYICRGLARSYETISQASFDVCFQGFQFN